MIRNMISQIAESMHNYSSCEESCGFCDNSDLLNSGVKASKSLYESLDEDTRKRVDLCQINRDDLRKANWNVDDIRNELVALEPKLIDAIKLEHRLSDSYTMLYSKDIRELSFYTQFRDGSDLNWGRGIKLTGEKEKDYTRY
jgi:hypothetical protein